MKKLCTTLLTCGLISTSAVAESIQPTYNISINPIGILLGNTNIKFEYYKYKKFIPIIEGNYWYLKDGDTTYSAYGIGFAVRKYKGNNFDKWFYQMGTEIGSLEVKVYDSKGTATYNGVYILGGYRWNFSKNGTIELGLGAGFY